MHERNVAFLRALVGDEDLAQPATFADGRTLSLGDALDEAASRAGQVDLARLVASSDHPYDSSWHLGAMWIIESGSGPCTMSNLAPQPIGIALDPQLWLYPGNFGVMQTSDTAFGVMLDWTGKSGDVAGGHSGFTAVGSNDNYCFNFGGSHFAFPFVSGAARWN